jgi:hypothetical protein
VAYAIVKDVEDRFIRPLEDDETRVVTTRLEDAERIIKARIPDLDTKVSDGVLDQGTVAMVEADMILRLIRNPDGFTQETDGNYSYSVSAQVASGVLDVLSREWTLLGVSGGAFVIAPYMKMPWEA